MHQSLTVSPPVQVPESTTAIRVLSVPSTTGTLVSPFSTHPPNLPSSPSNCPSVLHLYICVVSEMFPKQSQKVCSLLGLSFFPFDIILWSPLAIVCVHVASFSSLSRVRGTDGPQFVTIHLVKDIGLDATFWPLQIKLPGMPCAGVCVDMSSPWQVLMDPGHPPPA